MKIAPEGWAAIVGTSVAVASFGLVVAGRVMTWLRRIVAIWSLPPLVNALGGRIHEAEKNASAEVEALREEVQAMLNEHEKRAHAAIQEVKGEVRVVADNMARRDDQQRIEGKIDDLIRGLALGQPRH